MKRINRHAQVCKHKRKLKRRYGIGTPYGGYRENIRLHEEECRNKYGEYPNARNGGYEYWKPIYITGPRQYAKHCTNRVIRARYRDLIRMLAEDALDEIEALNGSDYEKMFDYDWTIW